MPFGRVSGGIVNTKTWCFFFKLHADISAVVYKVLTIGGVLTFRNMATYTNRTKFVYLIFYILIAENAAIVVSMLILLRENTTKTLNRV